MIWSIAVAACLACAGCAIAPGPSGRILSLGDSQIFECQGEALYTEDSGELVCEGTLRYVWTGHLGGNATVLGLGLGALFAGTPGAAVGGGVGLIKDLIGGAAPAPPTPIAVPGEL